MSDLIKHILIGETFGELSSISKMSFIKNKYFLFSTGLSSHIIMDLIDKEYVVNWFNYSELKPAVFYIFFQSFLSIYILYQVIKERKKKPDCFKIKMFSILGAVIPDIIDGLYSILNPEVWYNGSLIFFWHRSSEYMYTQTIGATIAITFSLFLCRFYLFPYLIGFFNFSKKIKSNKVKSKK